MRARNVFSSHHRISIFPVLRTNRVAVRNVADITLNYENSVDFPLHGEETIVSRFSLILRDCSHASALQIGRQVHAQIIMNGFSKMGYLKTKVLSMYILCGNIIDAKDVFFQMERRYSLPWTWMIRGFTILSWFRYALLFYFKMLGVGLSPDKFTFPYVIKACCGLPALQVGRLIHEKIRGMGLEEDVFVGSALIKMYADNDSIEEARNVFDKMIERDIVLWNVMISGYVTNGDSGKALGLFEKMRETGTELNSGSFVTVLSVCASEANVEYGSQLHGLAIRCGLELDASVANTIVAMYSKCQRLGDAHKFFGAMPQNDLVTWNCMISGCVQNGFNEEALDLFNNMLSAGVKPDSITFASFLPSVCETIGWKQGKEVHGYIIRNGVNLDVFLKSALIDLYFKCRDVDKAQKVFDTTLLMDVVIYSAMISGYVLNGMSPDALDMFRSMISANVKPNSVTLAGVLPACASLVALRLGKELHCYTIKNGFEGKCYVGSALIDMYAKCGRVETGYCVFKKIHEKDSVLWNTMITSFSQNGQPEEAIHLFRLMGSAGAVHDCVTISAGLSSCANLPALLYGKEIHGFIMKCSLRSDLFAESALIDMYGKCGDLGLARRVFESMETKNEVSWNSMIAAYGAHGMAKEAFKLFHKMEEAGIKLDHVTFLVLISACGHSGIIDDGLRYFHLMTDVYGIEARMEHYACMVDLFGRAGRLDDAFCFIRSMPFEADAGIWGALLGACRVHHNVELAELASRQLFKLDPQNSGYYMLMSNISAVAGRWNNVLKVRSLMQKRGVQKIPGISCIEINRTNQMFVAADRQHPESAQIYLLLKCLYLELQEEGYVPQLDIPLHPMCTDSQNHVAADDG
ncbi:pentatricopeptide repeat-containing protein At4g21300 [Aristolochia californica]|uniref:pentatricopeptide repeat-containing protein At4g21300 n=1 Tax=Aristolochia californica TaxID=171875 RepID=UPI0035DE0208